MPGIVGIVSGKAIDENLLDQMVNSIKYENFYRVDKYINSNIGIARIHLGIFNPEAQPIFNENGSLFIIFDGKIYDYREEMKKLKAKGHKFRFENDPEFCLHSYEEYGLNYIEDLNGSFFFVIHDVEGNKTIIANDRYGLRPHYYTINDERLLFASEIKAILQDQTFKKDLNDEAVADWFAFGEILGNKTFLKDIEVLPPASICIYDGQNFSIDQYWDFNYDPDYNKSEEKFVDELVKAFKKAVKIRMENNHCYGVSLSGGLDSRVIIAAIDKNKRKDVFAFSFGSLNCDEVRIAKKVSKIAGTSFKAIEITPEMIIKNTERTIHLGDGLYYVGLAFLLPVFKKVRKHIEVAFDGFAFDLLLGGSYINDKILKSKSRKDLFNILSGKRLFTDAELKDLLDDEYYEKIEDYPSNSFTLVFKNIKSNFPANMSDHFALQNHVRRNTIGGIVLDRNYVEFSHPTYDYNVIDIILKIPPELRYDHRIYRKFLKRIAPELAKITYNKTMISADAPLMLWKICRAYLEGKELIKKCIQNFSKNKFIFTHKKDYVNFYDWFCVNEEWKSFFKELLLNENGKSEKYFNQDYIKTLFQEQASGKNDNSMKLLYVASFKIFLKSF